MASFSPVKSFVDPTFFTELGKFKLDTAKLSESVVDITGVMSVPAAAGRPAALRLSGESFPHDSQISTTSALMFDIKGRLTNLNTIDAFKELDKAALLRQRADELIADIASLKILDNLFRLLEFDLITFSDLKKYKFYYWFCFPALPWQSAIERRKGPDAGANLGLNSAIEQWMSTVSSTEQLAFVISGDTDFKITPLASHYRQASGVSEPQPNELQLGMVDFGSDDSGYPWHLRNLAALLACMGYKKISLYIYRDHPSKHLSDASSGLSFWANLEVGPKITDSKGSVGWERTSQGKLMPKMSDLGALANPLDLANQAVDLNLKLMKWRAAPDIDLETIKASSCLLLGAGTLGCYVARGLMAWGVRKLTFVDNGKVSYSNPVRQPLYTLEDCIAGANKAETAARALQKIHPGVDARGLCLDVPMAGHPVTNELKQREDYDRLVDEIRAHDVVFLLMDSRESRWLPTVVSTSLEKLVINVAIGFDSFVVMRHGYRMPSSPEPASAKAMQDSQAAADSSSRLGCYFCNDVVAPIDSVSRQSLDQMCTVTRPGVAQLASGHAVELVSAVLQHASGGRAPANASTVLGPVYHQLRGFLLNHNTMPIWGPAFDKCSGCGPAVIDAFEADGWEFVKRALSDSDYLSELTGLRELQRGVAALDFDSDDGLE